MKVNASAPWHKESFNRFLKERLPGLLAQRLPLAGYEVESAGERTYTVKEAQTGETYDVTGEYFCTVRVTLATESGDLTVQYAGIPQPDREGLFVIDGSQRVVVPIASDEALDKAEVLCVGEQLYDFIEERLGEAPRDLPWDESLARSWLPLDKWVNEFLRVGIVWNRWDRGEGAPPYIQSTSHLIDRTNWLATRTHLRRIIIRKWEKVVSPSQFGRTCPFETPEGPNIGHFLTVANGAEIRDRQLEIVDDCPEATLGLSALMAPFLEHNDANRQLMGANMMRQWCAPPDPEPALVQTGNEPDAPDFWCGRNLLTAFVSWGAGTFDDGIVISESCAKRLDFPHPVEPGDKLSNRHGSKGTVTYILPDDEMPHLSDGTPVELVFSFVGCHTRMNFGQIREALVSRIARAEGVPAVVPPFHAPKEAELRERLKKAGLPESGMETLTIGRSGKKLQRPSTVGWVYWGKTVHLARHKIHASVGEGRPNRQSEAEYLVLRDAGAFENIAEQYNTRALDRPDSGTLAERAAAGPVEQAGPPTPLFASLVARLRVAGIEARLEDEKVRFRLAPPKGDMVNLARPVAHPWLRGQELATIGAFDECPEYTAVVESNAKLCRVLGGHAPESLAEQAFADLERRVRAFFDVLLTPGHLRFGASVLFSGRTVLSPGEDLRTDQLGLPDDIAWTLFGPLVTRELGDEEAVNERTPGAAQTLDAIMARSWILLTRAPAVLPTSVLAFRPVRRPGRVIRIPPLACRPLNADFDGDQAAVFLPLTKAGQREAGERLSISGHLQRDPALIKDVVPSNAPVWGLAALSLAPEGLKEIAELAGIDVAAPEGFVSRGSLLDAMAASMARDGVDAMLGALERLTARGFEVAKESGASISPFIGASLTFPPEPPRDDLEGWNAYLDEIGEQITSSSDFSSEDLGPQLLAVKSRARGVVKHVLCVAGKHGVVIYGQEAPAVVSHSFAEGLTPSEVCVCVVSARMGLAETVTRCTQTCHTLCEAGLPRGFNVVARAMRAERPGIVFARAAATGEVDPLNDLDSRLFVGLPPQ